MPLNSVNTNIGARVALQSLNRTTTELEATQKRISTGYRVADAQDDGAAFAVAERVRGDIAATTSANEQLGGAKGLLDVTNAALENVSNSLTKLKTLTVKLADGTLSTDQRTQYQTSVKEITNNIKSFIKDASYNGTNIADGTTGSIDVITNASGDRYTVTGFDALTSIFNAVSTFNAYTAGSAAAALTATGVLNNTIATTLTQLNNFGSYSNYIEAKVDYNKSKIDAQEGGLGALVDADLAKESAKLQSLQIRQQLGTQALGIANQAPQTLLSLFR